MSSTSYTKKLRYLPFTFLLYFFSNTAAGQGTSCPTLSANQPPSLLNNQSEVGSDGYCDASIFICWDRNSANNASFVYSVPPYLGEVIVSNITHSGCTSSTFRAPCTVTSFEINWQGRTNPNGGGAVCSEGISLPVTLEAFYPVEKKGFIELYWSTSSETINEGFQVEKSTDGKEFEKFGFVNGQGNSSNNVKYYYSDRHPAPGMNYYRLKQLDFNGAFAYSHIVSVKYENGREIDINYYSKGQYVQIQKDVFIAKIEIFSISGGKMIDIVPKDLNDNKVDVSSLNTGMYVIVAQGLNGEKETYKFSKF